MECFYIALLVFSFNAVEASIYSNLKNNVLSLWQRSVDDTGDTDLLESNTESMRHFQYKSREDAKDAKSALSKATILKKARTHEEDLNIGRDIPSNKRTESLVKNLGREYYHMDPVLNELKRRFGSFRRKHSDEEVNESSSSLELKFWMDEWDEHWLQKKFEALNSTQPKGDVVNMAAARPWGVPCGDPNQHDSPWGNCMLPMECDPEYRIYRGDYFCSRTRYICCALLQSNYDLYQGLDVSFEGTSFSTDSNEKNRQDASGDDANRKNQDQINRRKRERQVRKREIRKSIVKIVQEIRKILDRAFRNGTAQRKKKTKELKKFIEMLKRQNRKDRQSVVSVHEYELEKIDEELQSRLDKVENLNLNFMGNSTFRDIVVNGTVNKSTLRKLLRTYPQLANLITKRRTEIQVSGENGVEKEDIEKDEVEDKELKEEEEEDPTVLEYDLEYGKLYY